MMVKFLPKILLLGIITTLAGCNSNSISTNSTTIPLATLVGSEIITLGDISDNPQKKIRRFQPLADYLAANLSQFDIGKGKVKIAPDIETMIQWLKSGEIDMYFDSPYPAMLASDRAGAIPILRRWKQGDAEYHTVIFTMKDSGINSLAELTGKMIAFDDKQSTSGYMLPLAQLLEVGLNPLEKKSTAVEVEPNAIGYIFSDDDENTVEWVISSRVAAGAVDNQAFAEIPAEIRQQMNILTATEPIARNIVLVSADTDPELIDQIKHLLLNLDRIPEGNNILREFAETAKFDEFPAENSLQRMREIYELVQNRADK